MNCDRLISLLSEYIDGGLDEQVLHEAREHLATCKNCQVVLDTTEKTIQYYRVLGQEKIPQDIREKLKRKLHEALDTVD